MPMTTFGMTHLVSHITLHFHPREFPLNFSALAFLHPSSTLCFAHKYRVQCAPTVVWGLGIAVCVQFMYI